MKYKEWLDKEIEASVNRTYLQGEQRKYLLNLCLTRREVLNIEWTDSPSQFVQWVKEQQRDHLDNISVICFTEQFYTVSETGSRGYWKVRVNSDVLENWDVNKIQKFYSRVHKPTVYTYIPA